MRAYTIYPTFEFGRENDGRVPEYVSLAAGIVVERLRAQGDDFHYVVDWRNPGDLPWRGWREDLAEPHVVRLNDAGELAELVRMSVDPYSDGTAGIIRSIATGRAVRFGDDGFVFLCLRYEDEPPASPDAERMGIEEQPELLTETDYFDGWVR